MSDKSNKYGYVGVDIPAQSFGANKGVFNPAEINDLVANNQWTTFGQLELIQTQTVSGVADIEFTDIKQNIYNVHFMTLALDCTGGAGTAYYSIQFYENGIGWETASVYQYAYQWGKPSGTFSVTQSTTAPSLVAGFFLANNPTVNAYHYFYNLGDSSKYSFQTTNSFTQDSVDAGFRFGSGVLPQTSTVTGIRLLANATTTSTGTVSLYGIRYS